MAGEVTGVVTAFRRETTAAIGAVERALDVARSRVGADEITFKAARDLVTATDVAIEDSHADPDAARRERAAASVANAIRAFRWDIRALSTTLALAYVAAGRVSAYVLFWTSAVHSAAGSLLASEAGAIVSDIDGTAWSIDSDSIVASATAELHADLVELIRVPTLPLP